MKMQDEFRKVVYKSRKLEREEKIYMEKRLKSSNRELMGSLLCTDAQTIGESNQRILLSYQIDYSGIIITWGRFKKLGTTA